MTTAAGEERVPYEALLRVVGQYLDEQGARSFTLLELTEGLSVCYRPAADGLEQYAVCFTWDDLTAECETGQRRRQRRGRGRKGAETAQEGRRSGYQDILRLLGHELEKVPAYTIALDELEDGILTTYLYLDPAHGYLAKKRMVVIPRQQEQMLLTTARARRARLQDKRWGIRLFSS
jgi:hypothetical protein